MVILNSRNAFIDLPKLERCKLANCNVYYLILHNNYTKEVWLFKVRDFRSNNVRFLIRMDLPDEFEEGEYNYYLVSCDDWEAEQITTNYPEKSRMMMCDKNIVSYKGFHILSNERIVVTNKFKPILVVDGKIIVNKSPENKFIATSHSSDTSVYGDILHDVDIICTGILKYQEPESNDEYIQYEGGEYSNYIQYKG